MDKKYVAAALGMLLFTMTGSIQAAEPPEQKPFSKTELDRFLADYPGFTEWLSKQHAMSPMSRNNPWVMSGLRFNPAFSAQLTEKGWNPDRFFYLLNHVNTGLMLTSAEKDQAEAQARMAREQKEFEERTAQNQQNLQQEMNAGQARLEAQMNAQKEQIRTNPHIPPHEKQRILDQMSRHATGANPPLLDAKAQAEAAQKQQANWITAQEQAIRTNPYMPPMQRQQALAQLQQTRQSMQQQQQQQAAAIAKPLNPAATQAEMMATHQKWFENQKQALNNNPAIPADQKKRQLEQLQESEKHFKASLQQAKTPTPLLPPEEKTLIEANQQRLSELFSSK
ncbi:MAG: hypothetical protein HQL98_01590 [Magnetococcales bacterium]|nr:hypothetical protein [Magnetococcales bacterium]